MNIPKNYLTDLQALSNEELQARFEPLYKNCSDLPCKDTVQNLLHELQVQQIELEMQNRQLQEAQQQIEEARDRYADLYDFAPVCYVTFDSKGCIQDINLTGAGMLGQERTRLLGRPFSHWLSVLEVNKFFNHISLVQQGYDIAMEELELMFADGRSMDVRLESVSSTELINGEPTCRSVIINISARKQAERKLRDQSRQLQLVTDAMPALVAYVDRDERYRFVNKFYEQWFKQPRDRIIGSTVRELIGADAYAVLERFIQCALVGTPVTFEVTVPYQQQGLRDVHANYIPDFGVDGKVAGYFVMIRDVTESKKHEEENKMRLLEAAHVARINTMGEMVTEIAHELNQPLAAISIYSDTVSRMLNKGDAEPQDIHNALREINIQAGRASQVIGRLRAFIGKNDLQIVETNINALVKEVLKMIEVEVRWHGIQVKPALAPDIPAILVDQILIEQVILNLARNAIDAMEAIDTDKRHLLIRTSLGRHHEVEVEVEDSGPGLSVAEIEQAFEPFYSTKQQGMGMGLSISRSIIKAHHGRLWAIPNEQGGTTFTFTLPDSGQAGNI